MATVFFKINDKQDQEIKSLMEKEGYTSKAEFFRFLVKFFKYQVSSPDTQLEKATKELAAVLDKLDKQGKLNKNTDEQLDDV
jgi:Arc/MetJ-type ribon-helix-helix transcriptional regulator